MEIVQMQAPDEKPTTTTSPGINIISLEFAGPNKNSGVSAGGGAEEQRRLERVQDEEKIEECTTLKGEPSKIMDPPVCLPPLTIKIPSREFNDEKKKKNPIVVDGEGVKEERTLERTTDEQEEKDECTTPKGEANRIPAPTVCPPPPARRFKRSSKQITEIPPDKYFPVPSDLNSVFIPLKKIRTS